jgi:hypothetical protein
MRSALVGHPTASDSELTAARGANRPPGAHDGQISRRAVKQASRAVHRGLHVSHRIGKRALPVNLKPVGSSKTRFPSDRGPLFGTDQVSRGHRLDQPHRHGSADATASCTTAPRPVWRRELQCGKQTAAPSVARHAASPTGSQQSTRSQTAVLGTDGRRPPAGATGDRRPHLAMLGTNDRRPAPRATGDRRPHPEEPCGKCRACRHLWTPVEDAPPTTASPTVPATTPSRSPSSHPVHSRLGKLGAPETAEKEPHPSEAPESEARKKKP